MKGHILGKTTVDILEDFKAVSNRATSTENMALQ